jgi:hypothetical protein
MWKAASKRQSASHNWSWATSLTRMHVTVPSTVIMVLRNCAKG